MGRTRRLYFVSIFLLAICMAVAAFGAPDYKAGAAKASITPEDGVWLSGYASREKPSAGKLHDIFVKALALEDAKGKRIVLVTGDIIGFSAELSASVSKQVREKTGLERSSLLFSASHTHSAPIIRSNLETMYDLSKEQWDRVAQFNRDLEDQLVRIICDAVANLKPANVYRGCGSAEFAANRREYTLTGVTIGVNPIGPVDHDVPVMKVEDETGNLLAIVFGYACHNTTLSGYEINGDYAGFAETNLEEEYPNATALFFNGCGADSNPNPRRSIELCKAHGRELSVAVEKVLTSPMKRVKGDIQASFKTVDLPLTAAPTKEQLETQVKELQEAQDKEQQAAQEKDKVVKGHTFYLLQRAKGLLARAEKEGKISDTYPYPVQAWMIGDDFLWLALGGEIVVDYSLLFKHMYGRENTWVTGYANDVFAYIPSLRVLREGGYEADDSMIYYGIHGPWKPEIEKIIVETVKGMVGER